MSTLSKTIQDKVIPQTGYYFDAKEHLHYIDGKRATGVTSVLQIIAKNALIQWSADEAVKYFGWFNPKYDDHDKGMAVVAEKWKSIKDEEMFYALLCEARTQHAKRKKDAGDKGIEIHEKIEKLIKWAIQENNGYMAGILPRPFDENKLVSNFIDWAEENKVKFLESEKHVYSKEWWVGGIADLICEIDGKKYVGDVKTSSAIYPEHYIQAAAYAKMLKEMGLYQDLDGVIVINCKKDGKFELQTSYGINDKIKAFEAALTLYRFAESYKNL